MAKRILGSEILEGIRRSPLFHADAVCLLSVTVALFRIKTPRSMLLLPEAISLYQRCSLGGSEIEYPKRPWFSSYRTCTSLQIVNA